MQQLAAQRVGEGLSQICFSGAGRTGKEKDADRLAALLESKAPAYLRRQIFTDRILSNNFGPKSLRQRLGVDKDRLRSRLQAPLKFFTVRKTVQNVHKPAPPGKRARQLFAESEIGKQGEKPAYSGRYPENASDRPRVNFDPIERRGPPKRHAKKIQDLDDRGESHDAHEQGHPAVHSFENALHRADPPEMAAAFMLIESPAKLLLN
ncbi:hypothetical protein [Rhodomicrobium lacus]|uniref:hypothetical protein n=1 Tax=Rhodomicrobium lacus TaxID=2498452 RepID=UPI00349F13CE